MRKVPPSGPTRPLEVYRLPNGYAVKGYWHEDQTSPDKRRFKAASPREFARVVEYLRNQAEGMCEKCATPHFIGKFGDPHHSRNSKMAGAVRDDRFQVAGIRQLFYVCRGWHVDEHDGRHDAVESCAGE